MLLVFAPLAGTAAFEQDHRINALVWQFGTDSFATNNALGGAFTSTAQPQLRQSLSNSVADGSISIIFTMPGLVDLTGSNAPSLQIGLLDGIPYTPSNNPVSYSGNSDLDWWYFRAAASVDADGVALQQIAGSIVNQVLDAGPERLTIGMRIGSMPAPLTMWNTFIRATTSAPSTLLQSTNNLPPGHRPSENLDPSLKSFSTMNAGRVKGNVTAASLAAIPIPQSLLQSNDQGYTTANTMLDVIIGGMTTFGGLIQIVNPTQPDKFDPAAPTLGAGPPYRFSLDAGTKHVNTCRDKNNAVVSLDAGLNASAYSAYYQFASDRVIALKPPLPVLLTDVGKTAAGAVRFAFTNQPDAFLTVLSATNITQPPAEWTIVGSPSQIAPGLFQFIDFDATNHPQRFYRVRFP